MLAGTGLNFTRSASVLLILMVSRHSFQILDHFSMFQVLERCKTPSRTPLDWLFSVDGKSRVCELISPAGMNVWISLTQPHAGSGRRPSHELHVSVFYKVFDQNMEKFSSIPKCSVLQRILCFNPPQAPPNGIFLAHDKIPY